jgi:hypothetical protein
VQKGNHIISKIIFRPYSTFLMISLFKVLTYFDNKLLSMVIICETFITDSFGNLLSDFFRCIFPGAFANETLDVITAQIIVFILLLLKLSACIINTGRLKPGHYQSS